MMAMIHWVDQRLMNWAMFIARGYSDALGYATVNMTEVRTSGYAEAAVPINACEASDTSEAISGLPPELRRTIELYYLETTSRVKLSKRLNCAYATVDARLTRAHKLLAQEFTKKSCAIHEARQHAERMSRGVR